MTNRSTNAAFRRVDVDQYTEEDGGIVASEAADLDDSAGLAMSDAELSALLAAGPGEAQAALAALLTRAPVNARSQAVKDQALGQVMRVLMHIRGPQIEACVTALPEGLLDVLMKYIYRGFEVIADNHAHLLAWHEKTLARGQIGCVVRVLTDRKRV